MKKRIIIEGDKVKVEGANKYRTTAVIADLILALIKIAKVKGLPKEQMVKAIMEAWRLVQPKVGD